MNSSLRDQLLSKTGYMEQFEFSSLMPDENELLDSTGYWLEELASGKVRPESKSGEHFVEVVHGRDKPRTKYEKAWCKLQATKEVYPIFLRLLSGDFSSIREFGGGQPDILYDSLIELIRTKKNSIPNKTSSDRDARDRLRRAEIKVLDVQHNRESIDGGSVVNFGGLHNFTTWNW